MGRIDREATERHPEEQLRRALNGRPSGSVAVGPSVPCARPPPFEPCPTHLGDVEEVELHADTVVDLDALRCGGVDADIGGHEQLHGIRVTVAAALPCRAGHVPEADVGGAAWASRRRPSCPSYSASCAAASSHLRNRRKRKRRRGRNRYNFGIGAQVHCLDTRLDGIVSSLSDRIDAMVRGITSGLPAESSTRARRATRRRDLTDIC